MMLKTISGIGVIATLITTIAFGIGLLIGASYHPDAALRNYLLLAVACLVGLFVISVFLKRWHDTALSRLQSISATLLGVMLSVAGLYFVLADFGDVIFHFWPMITGLCLVAVASEVLFREDR